MRPVLSLLLLLASCASVGPLDLHDTPTFTLAEVRAKDELSSRIEHGAPFIVRVQKGDEVPLIVSLEIPGITLLPGKNAVRFDRDVFVHYGAGSMHVSADGETWAPMGDFKAIARLFGLGHGGSFQAGAGMTREEGPQISLKLTAQ